jgi:hypothetical protein
MNGTPKGTLEELEGGDKWTESPDDTFPIIALCRLARKPLDKFTIEERAFWLRSPSELARAQGLAAQALKKLPTQDDS